MKPLQILITAFIIVAIAFVIISNTANVTGTAPMLELPLLLRNRGTIVPHEQVRQVRYRFDERRPSWDPLNESADWKEASPLGDGFRIAAPYTIMKIGGKKVISPRYRSLFIRVEFKNGSTFSMIVPVISDMEFDGPIQMDCGFDRNET